VVRRVGYSHVKLLYDIYHMQIMESDLVRTIGEYHEHIGHYHTGGNPGRNEIDERQEIYYPAVVATIRATGYEGYLGPDFQPRSVDTTRNRGRELPSPGKTRLPAPTHGGRKLVLCHSLGQ